ncbi:MAG: XRE family transcriptional regulator [Lysobacter sp.]|nr:XRE family transcriptional regulator [Lysobacter sp.]
MATRNPYIGSSLDEFLAEDGSLEEVTAIAMKRVVAWQIAEAMKAEGVSKKVMAERMHTSRAQLDRVLDQEKPGLTFETLSRAATALGYRVKIGLVPA